MTVSQNIGFSIDYDVLWNDDNVRKILMTLREAVAENWSRYSDGISPPAPGRKVDVEEWLAYLSGEQKKPTKFLGNRIWMKGLYFNFSPLTIRTSYIICTPEVDGDIGLLIRVSDSIMSELFETRYRDRQKYDPDFVPIGPRRSDPDYDAFWDDYFSKYDEDPWPSNRACLLHCYERLLQVLPVESSLIDDELASSPDDD
jgi:hypothetical protein